MKSRRVSQTGKCWRAKFARNVSTDHCSTVVLAKEVLRSALSAGRRSNFEPGSCRCSRRAMLSNRSCGELSQTYGTSLELNYRNHLWPSIYLAVLPSGYGNLAQGGDSIYSAVDYKRCSGGPNWPNRVRFLANLTCQYKFRAGKQKNTTQKHFLGRKKGPFF